MKYEGIGELVELVELGGSSLIPHPTWLKVGKFSFFKNKKNGQHEAGEPGEVVPAEGFCFE